MSPAARATPWYRSIRFRLVAAAIVIEIFMLALLVANSYRLVTEALESQTRVRLDALAPLLNASLAGRVFQRDHSEITAILQQLARSADTEISYIRVLDQRGEPLAGIGGNGHEKAIDSSVIDALDDLTYDMQIPLTLSGDTHVGTVRFGLSLAGLATLRGSVLEQSLVIAATEVFLSLLLLVFGGYLLTRHIASLLAGARRVTDGDYGTPIPIGSDDEIGELAVDFNTMTATVRSRIAQLAESESRFRTIFDAAGDAIFIHDAADGRLIDVNRRMCEMYGCTREQALRSSIETFSANVAPFDAPHAKAWLDRAAAEGPQAFDWLARRHDNGEEFWVEVNLCWTQMGAAQCIIAMVRDISERKRHQHELEFLAHHDPLTRLPNRVLLADRLQQAIAQTQRAECLLMIAYLDLDGFKEINDTHGHKTGDQLLVMLAQRLKEHVRAADTVCRLGGDEFVLLIGDQTEIEECARTIERLLGALARPFMLVQQPLHITASIGVTIYPNDNADADTLMRHADLAMYVAKQNGRNRYHIFDSEQDRQVQARRSNLARIETALRDNEFVLHYQPKVDMRSGQVVGAEALIRWQHPEEGLLPPSRFLKEVEDSDLAIRLGEWVIATALAQLAHWQATGLRLGISVNISPRHLQVLNFPERLGELLRRHPQLPPAALELEVVESAALEDVVRVAEIIDACHALGVSFALDDFGTGYSSLAYFKRLRVDVLKIDQSFVRDLLTDDEDRAIVEGVIGLTRTFKRRVVAEGVESAETGVALLELGCQIAQGYCIAKPMPAADLPGWIANWQPYPQWRG